MLLQMLRERCKVQEKWQSNGRMQHKLNESFLKTRDRGMEWSSHETSILTPKCLKEEDEGLVLMHEMDSKIQIFAS